MKLDGVEISGTFAAFSVSFFRYISEDPRILLYLEKADTVHKNPHIWKKLYQELQDADRLKTFAENTQSMISEFDWKSIETPYIQWGYYGWITRIRSPELGFWDTVPDTQVEADNYALSVFNAKYIKGLQRALEEKTRSLPVFIEACNCYRNKCYTACASLLLGLIDSELIKNQTENAVGNKKRDPQQGKR